MSMVNCISGRSKCLFAAMRCAAPFLPLGSIAELQAAEITGRIVLFYGDLASQPLSPKSWFLKSERDDLIIGCLEAGRPAALLAPPAETAEYMQLTMDWELDLPAATIPLDIALTLLQQPGTPIHLTIQGERRPASARNIVARSSSKAGRPRVVLCAHFDTMINTPGASDNAAGVAVLLALAETLRAEELPYTWSSWLSMGKSTFRLVMTSTCDGQAIRWMISCSPSISMASARPILPLPSP
jgi:aminopeptidase YwaD